MAGITPSFKKEFIDNSTRYEVLEQVLQIVESEGLDPSLVKTYALEKQELRFKCLKDKSAMTKKLPLSENTLHLAGSRYVVRHYNEDDDMTVSEQFLRFDDLHIIKRDGRHERELTKADMDALIPGIVDIEAQEIHRTRVSSKAREIINELYHIGDGAEPEAVSNPVALVNLHDITVSMHAGIRWVQRIMDNPVVNETKAEEYRREHATEVNRQILDSYKKSTMVWKNIEDEVTYWFNEEQVVMFVVGGDGTIITLYEEDFGFEKDINRLVVKKQLGVLRSSYNNLKSQEAEYNSNISLIDDCIANIDNSIAVLEDKIEMLLAEKESQKAKGEHLNRVAKLARAEFNAEYGKLFKKWEV